jgi:hypothetical protein
MAGRRRKVSSAYVGPGAVSRRRQEPQAVGRRTHFPFPCTLCLCTGHERLSGIRWYKLSGICAFYRRTYRMSRVIPLSSITAAINRENDRALSLYTTRSPNQEPTITTGSPIAKRVMVEGP